MMIYYHKCLAHYILEFTCTEILIMQPFYYSAPQIQLGCGPFKALIEILQEQKPE